MKKRGIIVGIIAALIVLDQVVKAYVVQNIALGEIKSWIPNLVSLTYLQNRGAAFSMLQDQQWFFAVITLVVMAGAIWYLHKHIEDSFWTVVIPVRYNHQSVPILGNVSLLVFLWQSQLVSCGLFRYDQSAPQ